MIAFASQHPFFVGALVSAIVACLVAIGYIWLLDRRQERSHSQPVIGRDINVPLPRTVLRERKPSGPAAPTSWRNGKGHVRYVPEDAS